ncbi:DUF4231 domain-containing protein [Metamycoplasma neophronis]|uniref:DUF4231 domain-containing protein n=1 Tax=Metamycoplasma neophronis TaxID=872983 RepID=A0ABY2Z0A0_9BACT|nr:DUF4231 domain-containing protein [Metamycoplasma neophronis]TPR53379.1 DUF4231 domain-containing protein [Metamycoplasma neophronis]
MAKKKQAEVKNFDLVDKNRKLSRKYRYKYLVSRLIYILLGLIIMVISSLQIILNLFAIRWNEDITLKTIFLIIAILSSIIVFIQSIMIFFDFKTNKEENTLKLNNLQDLKEKYMEDPKSIKIKKLAEDIYDISKDNN